MMGLKCQERTLTGEQGPDWEREEPTSSRRLHGHQGPFGAASAQEQHGWGPCASGFQLGFHISGKDG